MGIAAINDAIDADDAEALMTGLTLPDVALHGLLPDCRHSYLEKLHELKVGKGEMNIFSLLAISLKCATS